jgi:hypothetical protein
MYKHWIEWFDHSTLQSLQDRHSEQEQSLSILCERLILSKPCAMLWEQVRQGEGLVPDLMRRLVVHYWHAISSDPHQWWIFQSHFYSQLIDHWTMWYAPTHCSTAGADQSFAVSQGLAPHVQFHTQTCRHAIYYQSAKLMGKPLLGLTGLLDSAHAVIR